LADAKEARTAETVINFNKDIFFLVIKKYETSGWVVLRMNWDKYTDI
jgi:hypothetical protein